MSATRLLIIDDDEDVLDWLTDDLQRRGFITAGISDPAQTFDAIAAHRLDGLGEATAISLPASRLRARGMALATSCTWAESGNRASKPAQTVMACREAVWSRPKEAGADLNQHSPMRHTA